ncbi:hypothetical protein EV175_000595 [Coemansia sp. RSA 1933]|nr:hypothetical protein EV175_000595 [Coemansia sp. RSA 1933]
MYDSKSDSGIKKSRWYNVTYAVRAITCATTLYTSFRIFGSTIHGSGGRRLASAIHYSLFMLESCCVIYFDPVTTYLFSATTLNSLAQNCQRMGIAYLIMIAIYIVLYIGMEMIGPKKGESGEPVEAAVEDKENFEV